MIRRPGRKRPPHLHLGTPGAARGSFALVCTKERILKIFRITGLINVFSIHTSAQDATSPEQ